MQQELTNKEKSLLFWASFLSLAACGFGFAFRIAHMGSYGAEFELTGAQVGIIAGSCFWPIAITMILFSLVVDKTGYKIPMFIAAALQIASGLGTSFADGYGGLLASAICAGLGHGIIEAVINPACAAVYPKTKTKMLTILHAAWPAGIVSGTLLIMILDGVVEGGMDWRTHALWIIIPAVIYAVMYAPCKFPVDERVKAGVPFVDMLKQVGFLGAFIASFMLIYQIGGEVFADVFGFYERPDPRTFFFGCLIAGLVVASIFGFMVKSVGKPLFFFLCLLMIPVATAELSTDNWIQGLMRPVFEGEWELDAKWAIIFSASIMFLLRTFAGGILKVFSPPVLMAVSGILSFIGLYWLGTNAAGIAVFIAFLIYAIGQTYYWPCILGFVAERYPKGGALTLNTVSAMGLLSLGMVGTPILGVAADKSIYKQSQEKVPALVQTAEKEAPFLWMKNKIIDPAKITDFGAEQIAGKGQQLITALAPVIAESEDLTAKKAEFDEAQEADASVDVQAIQLYDIVAGASAKDEDIAKSLEGAIPGAVKPGLDAYNTYGEMKIESGRDVLKFAAWFPAILVVAFGCIALYFKSKGGYKPVELEPSEVSDSCH